MERSEDSQDSQALPSDFSNAEVAIDIPGSTAQTTRLAAAILVVWVPPQQSPGRFSGAFFCTRCWFDYETSASAMIDDLTYFFVAEWRAEDVHADVVSDRSQFGYVSGKKAPPLNILEEAFETAGSERHRKTNSLGTIGPPGVD
jgi:hypothetical protein